MNDLIVPDVDFWQRKRNAQSQSFQFAPFGIPAKISANQADVLAAARLSAGRFSVAAQENTKQPIHIQIVVRSGPDTPVPANLPEQLTYTGVGPWITLLAGQWGHAVANLQTREAVLVLTSALAANTRLVSRYFIDHYLLNFILTEWAMLHASCVLSADGQRLVVMIAPHNTGKSTTALHLLRAGYHFLADGMALLRHEEQGFIFGGYPIGEVKLRDDVLAMFAEYSGQSVRVREHHKTVVNLRQTHPNQLVEKIISPASIHLCFVERKEQPQTEVLPLSAQKARQMLVNNTIFWDEAPQLAFNSNTLQALLRVASLYRLVIGRNTGDIIATIDKIT